MSESKLQRELVLAGFIPPAEHRQYEDVGRFALAVFDRSRYQADRAKSRFIEFVSDGSHFTAGPTDAFGRSGTSTAYGGTLMFSVSQIRSLVFEYFDLDDLDHSAREEFEEDYCESFISLMTTECLLGALMDYSKHSQMSYWSASIADPRNAQVPPHGALSCNGPVILHENRFSHLESLIQVGSFTPRGRYHVSW